MREKAYKAIVIGGSAGSMDVLLRLFSYLPETFGLPIIVVCHLHLRDDGGLVEFFNRQTALPIREAAEKEPARSGNIYFPPADYHLLVERDATFSLSIDRKVTYSRPSIDMLFESAALAWADGLIGIVLTGANNDGAEGIRAIKKYGGLTLVQDPADAAYPIMPQAAIDTGIIDKILSVDEIGRFLKSLFVGGAGK